MPLTPHEKEFLTKLADLLDEYDASLSYTTADDGIHVDLQDTEVFAGFVHNTDELRKAVEA
jgi:hypothetical protein